jgi:ribonucleoside-diphosphate reductase beta chain
MLLKYQTENKYKGLCTLVDWSIKDENEHSVNNSRLFREFIKENSDIWDDELKHDIYEAARQIVSYEHALVDYFNPPHMDNVSLHRFIEYIADERLKGLGMKTNFNVGNNPLPFMDELLHNLTLTNFFEQRVVDYSKGSLRGNWEDVKNNLS